MNIIFISNYYNHHQAAISKALYSLTGGNFRFIATETMGEHRLKMGWQVEDAPPFVINAQGDRIKECKALIDGADVVILGHGHPSLVIDRLKKGRLTFRCVERVYKERWSYLKIPLHFLKNAKYVYGYKSYHLLCASAYAPRDYAITHAFKDRAYKWGYFPPVRNYEDVDTLIDAKEKSSILWVGRLIDLKHPEHAIEVARRLKADGRSFKLRMIGVGELRESIEAAIRESGLSDCVELLGSTSPDGVREYMEKSEIFLFTSDKNEGWGAVLNESMNSACAVVASHAIGSVPFLLHNGKNGYIYKNGDVDGLYKRVRHLLDNPTERKTVSLGAYMTVSDEWNADNAGKKLVALCERFLGGDNSVFYESGVLSKAELLKDNWL